MSLQLCFLNTEEAGKIFKLKTPVTTLGRETDNDICPLVVGMSRYHAEFEFKPPSWILRDLGSTNGVKVNGVKITKSYSLHEGDLLKFGKLEMKAEKAPEDNKKDEPVTLNKAFLKKNKDEGDIENKPAPRKKLTLPSKNKKKNDVKSFEETNMLIGNDIVDKIKPKLISSSPTLIKNTQKEVVQEVKKIKLNSTPIEQPSISPIPEKEVKKIKLNSTPTISQNPVPKVKTIEKMKETDADVEQKLRMRKFRAMKKKAKKDGLDINHENYQDVATNTKNIDRQAFIDTFNKDK